MGLKVAFAGTGFISKVHAKAAQKVSDVDLVAVVNHRPESMVSFAAEYRIPRQYATIEQLLKDRDVDRGRIVDAAYESARTSQVVFFVPENGSTQHRLRGRD